MQYYTDNIEKYNDADAFEQAFNSLSEYRQQKILEKKQRKNQLQSLAASVLLKNLLAEEYALEEKSLKYQENLNGKAFIKNDKTIFFNISHSEKLVACAVSENPIGIDIEKIREINFEIAERFFCEEELAFLRSISSEKEREEAFFKIWTQKEAYAKCIGETILSLIANFNVFDKKGSLYVSDNRYFKFENIRFYDKHDVFDISICEQISEAVPKRRSF